MTTVAAFFIGFLVGFVVTFIYIAAKDGNNGRKE